MIRIITTIGILFLGLMFPSWLFLICIFAAALFFPKYWEVILVGFIANLMYVPGNVGFMGVYILWGVGAFLFSLFVESMTRFHKPKDIV